MGEINEIRLIVPFGLENKKAHELVNELKEDLDTTDKAIIEDYYVDKDYRFRYKNESGIITYLEIEGNKYYKNKKRITKEEFDKLIKENEISLFIRKEVIGLARYEGFYLWLEFTTVKNRLYFTVEAETEKTDKVIEMFKHLLSKYNLKGDVTTESSFGYFVNK